MKEFNICLVLNFTASCFLPTSLDPFKFAQLGDK